MELGFNFGGTIKSALLQIGVDTRIIFDAQCNFLASNMDFQETRDLQKLLKSSLKQFIKYGYFIDEFREKDKNFIFFGEFIHQMKYLSDQKIIVVTEKDSSLWKTSLQSSIKLILAEDNSVWKDGKKIFEIT